MRGLVKVLLALVVCAVVVVVGACGGDDDNGGSSSSSGGGKVTITVFAAASLTDAFTAIGKQFQQENPDVTVKFNFAGSNTLVQQIQQGAPADTFASADTQNMDKLTKSGDVTTPKTFAKNKLVVVIPASNPGKISDLEDLANQGIKIAVADSSVPVGNYTLEVLEKMSESDEYGPDYAKAVKANFVTKETSVKNVLSKVQTGEVDAGYVYVSDAYSAGDEVKSIEIPDEYNVIADYPIATVKASKNASTSDEFIDYVLSAPGQQTLEQYKFLPAQ
jgi:molybdate transport system substrate-binding protein